MTIVDRLRMDLSLPVLCLAGLFCSYALFVLYGPEHHQGMAEATSALAFWFMSSWWLWHDSRIRRYPLPMSYGFLFLFFAPFVAPIYIFQTRRWWGFVTIALYAMIYCCLQIPFVILYLLQARS
jgi:hypothetical protein